MDISLNNSLIAIGLNSGADNFVHTFSYLFTASGSTTVTFLTASNGAAIDIDNVSVTESVPDSLPAGVVVGTLLAVLVWRRRR